MRSYSLAASFFAELLTVSVLVATGSQVHAQSTAGLHGRVVDPAAAIVKGASIVLRNGATGVQRRAETDGEGNYLVAALPVGAYRIEVSAPGFQTQIVENLIVEVGRSVVQDFQLRVGDISQEVTVTPASQTVERVTISVGQVVDGRTVQQIPLNGRYFLDLGLLVPGSVTPPQGAFSAAPTRGLGALAINSSGNREETVNYLINGITLNNLTFSSITFQPSINTITAVGRFGNLGPNVVIGPRFDNTDFSIIKNIKFGDSVRVQFRAEFFDLLNHANLGQPRVVVDSPAFGQINNTRFPTGESGSSRQVQLALKLIF